MAYIPSISGTLCDAGVYRHNPKITHEKTPEVGGWVLFMYYLVYSIIQEFLHSLYLLLSFFFFSNVLFVLLESTRTLTNSHSHTHTHKTHTHTHTHTCTYTHTYTHTHTHTEIHTQIHTVHFFTCIHTCIYTYMQNITAFVWSKLYYAYIGFILMSCSLTRILVLLRFT